MDMANGDGEPSLGLSKIINPNKSISNSFSSIGKNRFCFSFTFTQSQFNMQSINDEGAWKGDASFLHIAMLIV